MNVYASSVSVTVSLGKSKLKQTDAAAERRRQQADLRSGELTVREPNTFSEDLLHPLVRKLFLHLKEATLHLQ